MRRFDIPARKPDIQFPPGNPNIEAMDVPAKHSNWVVIDKYNPGLSPRQGGASLYVDGKETNGYEWGPNVFIHTPDGNFLYGLSNENGDSGIDRREINPKGWSNPTNFIPDAHERAGDIKYEGGKLYASSGKVYDFENPSLLGTCTDGGLVAPDSKNNHVFYLQRYEKGWRFHAFDTRSFTSPGWMDVPGVKGDPSRLVKWGENSFAFRTNASQIIYLSPYPSLFEAAKNGDVVTAQMLLEKGANPNASDEEGKTALLWAATSGSVTLLKALLAKGADAGLKDNRDYTPLMAAAEHGTAAAITLLLAGGADAGAKENDGFTALQYAVAGNNAECLALLLAKGGEVNMRDAQGLTLLMRAAMTGKAEAAKALIAKHANVNLKTDAGNTALKYAAAEGHTAIVTLLRSAGAKE